MMNNELIPTPMMSFGESVKTCFQKYVTFKGRARRSEYWWFWLLNLIVSIVTLVLDYKLDMINIEFGIGALSGLYTLIVFLPSLAVSVRRLHDTGHSGWYYLLTFIPILARCSCSTSLSATLLPRRTDTARARSTHRRHSNL